jgi:non-ribosomal peptide synthetase component F
LLTLKPSDLPTRQTARLAGWNVAQRAYSQGGCTHELVAEQAAATPGAPAVVVGGQQLNYRELNERANRLAHRLQAMGVGPEVLVACRLDRSIELAVVLLAILKAGGAYLPLDPTYPADRLRFMLDDAAAAVVITPEFLEAEATRRLRSARRPGLLRFCQRPRLRDSHRARPAGPRACRSRIATSSTSSTGTGVLLRSPRPIARARSRVLPSTPPAGSYGLPDRRRERPLRSEETRTDPAAMRDWLLAQEITVSFLPTPSRRG